MICFRLTACSGPHERPGTQSDWFLHCPISYNFLLQVQEENIFILFYAVRRLPAPGFFAEAIRANASNLDLGIVHPPKSLDGFGDRQIGEFVADKILDLPAGGADEMMVRFGVRIEPCRTADGTGPVDQTSVAQGRQCAVNGVAGDTRHAFANARKDPFGVRMIGAVGQFPEDLHSLVSDLHSLSTAEPYKGLDAMFNVFFGPGHNQSASDMVRITSNPV